MMMRLSAKPTRFQPILLPTKLTGRAQRIAGCGSSRPDNDTAFSIPQWRRCPSRCLCRQRKAAGNPPPMPGCPRGALSASMLKGLAAPGHLWTPRRNLSLEDWSQHRGEGRAIMDRAIIRWHGGPAQGCRPRHRRRPCVRHAAGARAGGGHGRRAAGEAPGAPNIGPKRVTSRSISGASGSARRSRESRRGRCCSSCTAPRIPRVRPTTSPCRARANTRS